MREEQNSLNAGELELEAALGRLAPQVVPDRRDEIAYEAGRRAGRRSAYPWRLCSGALAACLMVAVYPRATSPVPSPMVTAPLPSTSPPRFVVMEEPVAPAAETYLAVRTEVLSRGLDALPPVGGGGGRSARSPAAPRAVNVQSDEAAVRLSNFFGVRS